MDNISSTATPNLTQQSHKQGMDVMSKLLPIAIAIVVTNGLVFVLFYKRKDLRNSSNILLLGLAVCDFITGAVNIPYFIVFTFQVVGFKDFAHWMFILHTFTAISAAYHILAITAEKYLAIIRPLKHFLVTKTTVFKVLAGIWMVSCCLGVIPSVWREANSGIWLVIYSATCLVIVFLVPYVFMVHAYTVMFKAVSERKRPSQHRDRIRLQKKDSTDRKCILVFGIMAVIYLFCWLPYFTMMLVINVNVYINVDNNTAVDKASETIAITRYITSVINPLLYTFFKRDFWMAVCSFFVSKKESGFPQKTNLTLTCFSPTYSRTIRSPRCINGNQVTHLSEPAVSPCIESEENEGTEPEQFIVSLVSSV